MARSVVGHRRGTLRWRGRAVPGRPRRHGAVRRRWAGDLPRLRPPASTSIPDEMEPSRLLPGAQLRRGPPAHRLGLQPLGRRGAQPGAALLLHRRLRRPARRPVHLGRPQGLAAQRRGDRRVHRQPDPRGAVRADQRHGHRLPAGPERGRARRRPAGAERARRRPAGRGVPGRPSSARCTRTVRLGDSTVVFGRVLAISVWESAVRDGRPRIEHLQPAGPPRRQRVVDDRRGPGDPAHPLPRMDRRPDHRRAPRGDRTEASDRSVPAARGS